ncbi:MAG: hypothetical protein ACI91J_002907, partial [Yoonia sp.]
NRLSVFLNGQQKPELDLRVDAKIPAGLETVFLGGRSDRVDNWEGRLDEIALYDRALGTAEIAALAVH